MLQLGEKALAKVELNHLEAPHSAGHLGPQQALESAAACRGRWLLEGRCKRVVEPRLIKALAKELAMQRTVAQLRHVCSRACTARAVAFRCRQEDLKWLLFAHAGERPRRTNESEFAILRDIVCMIKLMRVLFESARHSGARARSGGDAVVRHRPPVFR